MKAWKFVAVLYLVACALMGLSHCQTPKQAFEKAIARTEGFYIKGTIPNRLHNPGDIMTSLPHAYPGQIGVYKHYAVFKSDKWGWAALDSQIQRVIDGTSTKYTSSMTMMEIAKVYAENYRYWGRTVCKILRIDPRLTFDEYFGLAPRVRMTYEAPLWLQHGRDEVSQVFPVLEVSPQIHRETGRELVASMSEWWTGEIE